MMWTPFPVWIKVETDALAVRFCPTLRQITMALHAYRALRRAGRHPRIRVVR